MKSRNEVLRFLKEYPYKVGQAVGYGNLNRMHNEWLKAMIQNTEDATLQAHRGSYKTTCVIISLSLLMLLKPTKSILFLRKTDEDVKEVIRAVKKMLESDYFAYWSTAIYGARIKLVMSNANELNTNLNKTPKGTSQLVGLGIGSSLTGKHFDYIFTDDIVNVSDRVSRAERERTKLVYQELQNIKNRGGRIFNTGTPWHKEDCFSIMPHAQKYDCYQTGLISPEKLEQIRSSMTASLFRANYELRHIADENIIFANPHLNADIEMVRQGNSHIDASYGGEDFTALSIVNKVDGKFYVFGKLYSRHVDDVTDEMLAYHNELQAGKIYCENNADKGYLAKALRAKGARVSTYHESTNKYIKITSYLKGEWDNVYFVKGTDKEYIDQICDYNENAEHDDAPDSLASMVRILWKEKDRSSEYTSIL